MWLFNIRGCDVECNPVAMSYAYITQDGAVLFIRKEALSGEVLSYLGKTGTEVKEYGEITDFVRALPGNGKNLLDERYVGYNFYKILQEKQAVTEGKNPTELLKAVKNATELANMEKYTCRTVWQ